MKILEHLYSFCAKFLSFRNQKNRLPISKSTNSSCIYILIRYWAHSRGWVNDWIQTVIEGRMFILKPWIWNANTFINEKTNKFKKKSGKSTVPFIPLSIKPWNLPSRRHSSIADQAKSKTFISLFFSTNTNQTNIKHPNNITQ